jgi:hypothetical protein
MSTLLATPVCHVIKGEIVHGDALTYGSGANSFATPEIDLNSLVWPRREPGPAFDVPVAEIIDLLIEFGEALRRDDAGYMAQACERMARTSPLAPAIVRHSYDDMHQLFSRSRLEAMLDFEIGDRAFIDGWKQVPSADGYQARVRAFPPRMVHILAGNAPGVAAVSIIRGALSKGVHLFKLPSNDLHTLTGMLRILAEIAPDHPVTRSFSAVYWRGGDAAIESRLFSPIFFDKLAAWGGETSLRSAKNYVGPGFELVSFDPKTSISMVGREVFAAGCDLAEVAELAAIDVTPWDQSACVSSRFIFIEAQAAEADRFCELLQQRMGVDRRIASAIGPRVPTEIREEVEVMRDMAPDYGVFGGYDGSGLVVRSDSPVDFHPDGKIVNVVTVGSLDDAVRHVSVATQTVGVWPPERKLTLRDQLASAGAQRVVTLGLAAQGGAGMPHDGFIPLHRFMRWLNDEG